MGTRSQRLRPPLRPKPLSLLGLTAFAIVCLVAAACGSDPPDAEAAPFTIEGLSSFGETARGELVAASFSQGAVFRLTAG